MRFTSNGPQIPDELLVARDAGDVVFFCGAGVSRARADLPDFLSLGRMVLEKLGAGRGSLALKLLDKAKTVGGMDGVGGLIATDRIFSLLEREFEVDDVRAEVAKAVTPQENVDLSAHRILLDLSTGRDGRVRLVTTNFDLLFEACDQSLRSFGPPTLSDPQGADFSGIIHLHGRVDANYQVRANEEFVVSSGDFGRAYLSDGWATRFIQSLLARFQVVFVGYTADDPPMQYLLEALRLRAGTPKRLYAFQDSMSPDALALWEHRGVQAIPFDNSNGYGPLWETLEAWSERARNIDNWYNKVLLEAANGPQKLTPHARGQVAHMLSTREGARRFALAREAAPASWLLAMDPLIRYATPSRFDPGDGSSAPIDPYEKLALDSDPPPRPMTRDDHLAKRTVPENAWDAFSLTHLDRGDRGDSQHAGLRGNRVNEPAMMPARLANLGIWLQRVAHQPIALWWAVGQHSLHTSVLSAIANWIGQEPDRFVPEIKQGWRVLIAARKDERPDPDHALYDLMRRSKLEGWTFSIIREYADIFRPKLNVRTPFGLSHPMVWNDKTPSYAPVSLDVEYPHPHELLELPDEKLAYAATLFRANLELAVALGLELNGTDRLYFHTTRADDEADAIRFDSYGLTGPIAHFQSLMARLGDFDSKAARAEIACWPEQDDGVFARLRIWAVGSQLLSPDEVSVTLSKLSDKAFWGSLHQRDLLFVVRDQWPRLSTSQRVQIEQRLLTGSYPWDESVHSPEVAQAHLRLDRLKWLADQGVAFSFDLDAEIARLRTLAAEWSEKSADFAAESNAPNVRGVEIDADPSELTGLSVDAILSKAKAEEDQHLINFVERRPFSGLAEKEPVRAFAALRNAAKNGDVPTWAWSAFLGSERRKLDRKRLCEAIATQLCRLNGQALHSIAYPVAEWMKELAPRFYDELSSSIDPLWNRMIEGLSLGGNNRPLDADSGWADDALNSPAGRMIDVLFKDPKIQNLKAGAGLPPHWRVRADQLLALPGDMRRYALVMISFHTVWLHVVDPNWVEQQLLTAADLNDPDGDAFWDGLLWCARPPSKALFERIKPALLSRALREPHRRAEATIMGGFLLIGWSGFSNAPMPEPLITSVEFREILVDADDDLRSRVLWQLQQWSKGTDSRWRTRVLPFLTEVWPRQRAFRTPEFSSRLLDFACDSDELFPDFVIAIIPRLVPVRGGFSRLGIGRPPEKHPARRFPESMLDLLWAVLGEDVSQWPYQIEELIDILEADPKTQADPRLSELRRRRYR